MGSQVFSKVQYGKESPSAHGTNVAATKMWLGQVKVPEDRKPVYPPYQLGLKARSTEGHIYQKLADGIILSGPENGAYFEMLPAMFSIFMKGNITPSLVTTGQGDYLWTFTPSLTASNTLDSLSLEYGDDQQAYEINYLIGKRLSFSGAMGQNQAVKAELECFGDQIAKASFTNALTKPTTNQMNAAGTSIYMDALWANKGTTAKTSFLREWSVEFLNNVTPKFHGGGAVIFDAIQESYFDFLLTVTCERTADAVTIFDAYMAQTPAAFEIRVVGDRIGTGAYHTLKMDFWGVPESHSVMDSEVEGATLDKFVIHPLYGLTGTAELAVTVTTDLSVM
jgi:hypothetical protein